MKIGNVVSVGLRTTIKNWYRTLRNLAVVALLSILVYLGIRILISSTAEDKAKHKEVLKDWFIALVLVFLMHFIMSAVIAIVNQINSLFNDMNNSVYINYGGTVFKSNFTGAMRFLAQSSSVSQAWVYTVIYLVIICYTFIFTIQYLKRVLYIAFYTMISPLVAITYPLDKLGDGKSQAFNKWFKEYTMTMALQPIHLVIYTMVVSSSLNLAVNNPIFALVAIGFLIPAEQFIRSLFGVESKADGGFGSFASGALTMKALDALKKPKFGGASGKGHKGESGSDTEAEDTKVRQASNKELDYWKNNSANNNKAEQNKQDGNNIWQDENNEVPPDFNFGNNNPWANENNDTYQEDNNNPAGTIDLGNNNGANQGQDNNNDEEQERVRMNAHQQGNEPDEENGNEQANEVQHELTPQEKFDNMRKMRLRQFGKKVAITGGKTLGKATLFTAKTVTKGIGAATFGTIGLAAGIASGKGIGETIKRTGVGMAAGVAAGTTVSNLAGKTVRGTIKGTKAIDGTVQKYQTNKAKDMKNAGLDDRAKAYQEKINSTPVNRARRAIKYDKIIDEYAMKNGKNIGYIKDKQRKELREKINDYDTNYGVSDKKDILKALEMEEKHLSKFNNDKEDTHKRIAEIMQLKNSYGREFINNKSKIEEFDNNLTNRGITGSDKDLIKELFYDAHGAKYKKTSTRGRTRNNGNAGQ